MDDFRKAGELRKDSFVDAIKNKTVFRKGNKFCYKSIYDKDTDYDIGNYEIGITRRTVAKVIINMRECSKNDRELTYNDVYNISQAYYEAKYDPRSLDYIAKELEDFYELINDDNRIRLCLFLMQHFKYEVDSGVETRIADMLDFMVYNLYRGGITVKALDEIGFFDKITILDAMNLVKDGLVSKGEMRDIIVKDLDDFDEVENDYEKMALLYNKFVDDPKKEKVGFRLLKLLEGDEICKLYLKGLLTDKEMKVLKPSKESVLKLDVDEIIKTHNNKYVYSLTSDDIFRGYGDKFLVKDLIKFSDNNMMKSEKILNVLSFKSLDKIDIDTERKDLLDFYNAETLSNLLDKGKINNRFVEMFNNELIGKVSEEDKSKYFENMRNELIESSLDKADFVKKSIVLYDNEFINKDFYNLYDFDSDTVLQAYSNGDLSEKSMFSLYNEGLVSLDCISNLYTTEELLEFYIDGKLNSDVLKSLPKDDVYVFLSMSMENGKLNSKDIYDCYVRENIDFEQFGAILSDNSSVDSIADFIDERISKDRIKELYTSFIISDDELERINKNGFISDEDCEKIRGLLKKDEFFDDLKKTKSIYIGGEENVVPEKRKEDDIKTTIFSRGNKKPSKVKISSKTIKDFYDELGGMSEYPVILGNTSLAGYSIVGFPDYELVVLENFDKVQNATYIMSFQQLLFYKNNEHKANMDFEIGSKSVLRGSDKVKVHNHTSGFGKNIVSSMKDMSRVASEKFKSDREYKEIIGEYINDIRDEYEKNR
ncbi:MAG: hypothetical protein IKG42_03710 [Clostridia bacterium]|nr:hypothetical protein [Clostridia bacterium]